MATDAQATKKKKDYHSSDNNSKQYLILYRYM